MASRVHKIKAVNKPDWLNDNLHYEVITGSTAYGCNGPDSDEDICGFCIPPKAMVFPHLAGEIDGFGMKAPRFEQWINPKENKQDATVYGIVKFFDMILSCNPNIIDILFVPVRCVVHCTHIGQIVRDNRKLFLSKKAFHSFKGYAFSQKSRLKDEKNPPTGKRLALVQKYGYDVKFAYHIVRLMNECRQILEEGDLTLDNNAQQYLAIREGQWTLEYLEAWFQDQRKSMEEVYNRSTLRYGLDEKEVKNILLQCLEAHYGNLGDAIVRVDRTAELVNELNALVQRYQ